MNNRSGNRNLKDNNSNSCEQAGIAHAGTMNYESQVCDCGTNRRNNFQSQAGLCQGPQAGVSEEGAVN